jgi:hypothetical protein
MVDELRKCPQGRVRTRQPDRSKPALDWYGRGLRDSASVAIHPIYRLDIFVARDGEWSGREVR